MKLNNKDIQKLKDKGVDFFVITKRSADTVIGTLN